MLRIGAGPNAFRFAFNGEKAAARDNHMAPRGWEQSSSRFDQILVLARQRSTATKLGEMLRGFGAHGPIAWTASETEAMEITVHLQPRLLFVERAGTFDGLTFVRHLRRSAISASRSPVILLSDQRTVGALRDAQNAGVHEFLAIPFSSAHLLKRLDVISEAPRPWIHVASYSGPDRRRFNSAEVTDNKERRNRTVLAKSA
jgi:CheY-like chemotaxis protein